MSAIRVKIGDMPPLLRSLVEGMLADNSQFELNSGGASVADNKHDCDVLVISESSIKQALPQYSLFGDGRELGIVAIAPDGHDAAVIRVNSHRHRLDEGPRESLSQAVIDAAKPGREPH